MGGGVPVQPRRPFLLNLRARWPRSLYARLLLSYFALSLFTLIVASGLLTYFYQSYVVRTQSDQLVNDGREIASLVSASLLTGSSPSDLQRILNIIEPFVGAEPWVVNRAGVILAATPAGENLLGVRLPADAVQKLLSGRIVTDWGTGLRAPRPSLSVAVPVTVGGATIGAVILHRPLVGIEAILLDARRLLVTAFLIAALLSVVLAGLLSRSVGRPLQRLAGAARKMAAGDLRGRVEVEGPEEVRELARTFNRAAEEIGRTLEEQRRLERMRRDFVANVSHEFRAPLTSLRGFIELLEDGTISPGESARYIGLMREDTERLSRLVSDLLDLSRIDAGSMPIRPQPVPAAEACQRAVESVAARARALGLALELAVKGNPVAWADGERVHQVLVNLLDNALAHTEAGGRIEVGAEPEGGAPAEGAPAIRFWVMDTGEGIPPEERELIWERFHRVDRSRSRNARSAGGTGLGLAIVKQLVELMGGRVGVESEPGEGSRFWFTLPGAEGTVSPAGPAAGSQEGLKPYASVADERGEEA